MRLLPALLLFLAMGYCNGTLISFANANFPSWFNQTKACNFCGQMTYGVVLSDNVETLISAIELYSEYNWCGQYYPYISLDYCIPMITNTFAFFYRPYYALYYPFRDYMCYGICGNSGEDYELT